MVRVNLENIQVILPSHVAGEITDRIAQTNNKVLIRASNVRLWLKVTTLRVS